MSAMRALGIGLALCGAAAVAAGYGGALHPALDALAVFRVPLGLATVLLLALLWRPLWLVAPGVALMALAVVPRLSASRDVDVAGAAGAAPAQDLLLYQKNLLFRLPSRDLVVADILARAPDIVTLQEVSRPNQAVPTALRAAYPAQNFCEYRVNGGPAVLSRWPMVPGSAACGPGLAAMQVETPMGRLWAVSIHLRWPWPYQQPHQLELLEPMLREMQGPKVIGGDFNNVAWSEGVARVERASGTARIGREAVTFALPFGGLGVGIDHILAGGGASGSITVLERLGSDHRGLLGRISLGLRPVPGVDALSG